MMNKKKLLSDYTVFILSFGVFQTMIIGIHGWSICVLVSNHLRARECVLN